MNNLILFDITKEFKEFEFQQKLTSRIFER